ncbi:hypothetical protein ANCDUO_06724 [Ancylostoma duodenale]|uniref:Uncharacterized protein n=1 Tax=Ancylostoma duodenale TaxID=51022 RepID=A0A0C2H0V9_9BILA|nr:hypothetical protein ANCDUO_06724 [Ancylostoma duodenale]
MSYCQDVNKFECSGNHRSALEGKGLTAVFESSLTSKELTRYLLVFILFKNPSMTNYRQKVTEALSYKEVAGNRIEKHSEITTATTTTTTITTKTTTSTLPPRIHVAAPACNDGFVELDNEPIPVDVVAVPQVTHDDFKALSSKIDYLYTQTVAKEGHHHKKALENARTAMLAYEHITRKNPLARTGFPVRALDLILESAYMTSSKMPGEVEKLATNSSEYFGPLFGEEWLHGRRKVTIRCEPCYEADRSTNPTQIPAVAKKNCIPSMKIQ